MGSSHAARLASLLGQSVVSSSPDLKIALVRLSVEIKERVANGSPDAAAFFSSAVHELSRIRGTAHADLRVACLFECGHYYYNSGKPTAAIDAARLAAALARQANQASWERKSETLLGIVHADAGGIPEAIMHYAKALDIARANQDRAGEGVVFLNLGVALNYGGLFSEAIPSLLKSLDITNETDGHRDKLRAVNLNLAQSYLFTDEFETSLEHVFSALRVSAGTPTDASEALGRTILGVTGVQACVELQDSRQAEKFRDMGREAAAWNNSHRSKVLAMIADGLVQVHFGNSESGLETLDQSFKQAQEMPAIRRVVMQALVKAHDTLGNPHIARLYIGELMNDFRNSRQASLDLVMANTGTRLGPLRDRSLSALEHKEMRFRALAAEDDLLHSRIEILERLAITADLREESSGEHGIRVGRLAYLLAEALGLAPEHCSSIELGARLHDIGKVAIPDRILLTSDELKAEERGLMCAHAVAGAEIVSRSSIPQLRAAEEIARFHHEWWNGHGYPTRLSGNRIPLAARIVALADVFDAMTHGRPYAASLSIDRALREIHDLGGNQFDPDLTEVFVGVVESLKRHGSDISAFDGLLTAATYNSPFVEARARIRKVLATSARPPKPKNEHLDPARI